MYLGIDLSLNSTGFVLINENGDFVKQWLVKNKKNYRAEKRIEFVFNSTKEIIKEALPRSIGIEGYSFGSRKGASFSIGEVGGVVKHYLYRISKKGIRYYVFQPKSIKKFAIGNGNAKKSLILKAVYQQWNFDTECEDIADAFAIAQLTRVYDLIYVKNKNIKLKSYQKDVIQKLLESKEND